ncbi:MAG: glutamine--tRNA ligase/YqeY domain fusion protein [Anaerofustis sp.]
MSESSNFIFNEIDKDLANGVYQADEIMTRFPPEPNGYLHIGHAKAIFINFSVKEKYHGRTNLRFDDTNPAKEDVEYTEAIERDIAWLGYKWDNLFYASDYFGRMYEYAVELIGKGLAYVDDQTQDEIKANRGTLTEKGTNSPYRDRSAEENQTLFREMKEGKYPTGSKVLRAKIDMASPNINMRDPVIYRILFETHHNTGDSWCIYPMYDYAHPIEDAIEGVTHSLCSLEFEDHRPFYDWLLDHLDDCRVKRPRQIEFARLNITNTIMSKRYLKRLVDEGRVDGWDDPRMPTLSGLRRRGVTPAAIRNFCYESGVAKANSVIDKAQFDYFVRDDLMKTSKRVMAVLNPLKVTIRNYPEGESELLDIPYNLDEPEGASRKVPFGRELYIEREDFMEVPPKKYFRLFPGNEVRLMGAYFITCESFVKDEDGNITEVICTYDPETKSGSGFTGRKVKGTIHWVPSGAIEMEARLYEELLNEDSDAEDWVERLNPNSLTVCNALGEPSLANAKPGDLYQFVRNGFFCADSRHSKAEHLVFNRTVSLKSSWQPPKEA